MERIFALVRALHGGRRQRRAHHHRCADAAPCEPPSKLVQTEKVGKEVFYSPSRKGEELVAQYREVREACLLNNLGSEMNTEIGQMAKVLRTLSGAYDQAARAATSL